MYDSITKTAISISENAFPMPIHGLMGSNFPLQYRLLLVLLFVSWNGGSQIRLYIQDSTTDIVEWCYDKGQGWRSTGFRTPAQPYTEIAATAKVLKGVP